MTEADQSTHGESSQSDLETEGYSSSTNNPESTSSGDAMTSTSGAASTSTSGAESTTSGSGAEDTTSGEPGLPGSTCDNPQVIYKESLLSYQQAMEMCDAQPPGQKAVKLDGSLYAIVEEQDNFAGLECLCEVTGDVTLSGFAHHLTGLDNLRAVGGSFSLYDNIIVADFSGLGNLEKVEGSVGIVGNYGTTSAQGFDGLTFIGGGLHIDAAGSFSQSFEGFNSLVTIEGPLYLYGMDQIPEFGGFSALKSVAEEFVFKFNTSVLSLSPAQFPSLESVGTTLVIEGNPALLSISGFSLLKSCGSLDIINNNNLTSIGGFGKLSTINNDDYSGLRLYGEDKLAVIPTFESLVSVSTINIEYTQIANIVFPALKHAAGIDIKSDSFSSPIKVIKFPLMETVDRGIYMHGSSSLSTFEVPKLTHIGGMGLLIDSPKKNTALKELDLTTLKSIAFDNCPPCGMNINGMSGLTSLGQFSLSSVSGQGYSLGISCAPALSAQTVAAITANLPQNSDGDPNNDLIVPIYPCN